jgi:hypothetical protein
VPQYEAIVATTMSVTRLTCDATYANQNGSILSVSNLSLIGPSPVQARDLLLVYNNTFNNPLNPSPLNIPTILSINSGFGTTDSYSATKAFLALPYLVFQPMSPWFNSLDLPHDTTIATTWSSGWAFSRIIIEKWTVIMFAIMMLGVYFWCVASLVSVIFRPLPLVTQFPLLDFASRAISGTLSVQNTLSDGPSSDGFRKMLQDKVLYLGVIFKKHEERVDSSTSIYRSEATGVDDRIQEVTELESSDLLLGSDLVAKNGPSETEGSAGTHEIQETIIGIGTQVGFIGESATPSAESSSREIERIGFAFQENEVKPLKRVRN